MSLTPDILRDLLSVPDRVPMPRATVLTADGTRAEMRINGMAATFLRPPTEGQVPAVLYCHAHGGAYGLGRRELTEGARWLVSPYAQDLLSAGFAVLCLDMTGFGARQNEGCESALAKAGMWRGKPLFGRMIGDVQQGFEWLATRPGIDPDRIYMLGCSMGAAQAMWMTAIEPRVAGLAQICMLADIAPLIATDAHDRHGPYLTVPGLLQHGDIGDVAALAAPRPHWVGLGARDPFTPEAARGPAIDRLRRAYATKGGVCDIHISPDTGHEETSYMRRAILDFLIRCARGETSKRAS